MIAETLQPVEPPAVVVTMQQARKALFLSGITALDVEAVLADNQLALIDWEYSPTVSSDSDLVNAACAARDLDKAALFALAVTL